MKPSYKRQKRFKIPLKQNFSLTGQFTHNLTTKKKHLKLHDVTKVSCLTRSKVRNLENTK